MLTDSTRAQLAELYTDAVALNWQRRAKILQSPTKTFADLRQSDQQLRSGIDALILLGRLGREKMKGALEEPLTRGEFFALAAYALTAGDSELIEASFALARSMPNLHDPLLSAIEWQQPSAGLDDALAALAPALRLRIAAGFGMQRVLPLAQIEAIYTALCGPVPTPAMLVPALQFVQKVGTFEMAQFAEYHLEHALPEVRLHAAQALIALLDPRYAMREVKALQELTSAGVAMDIRTSALKTLALHAPDQARDVLQGFADGVCASADTVLQRLILQGYGWIGRIDAIPMLIDHLADPASARLAAASITRITGSEPMRDGWSGDAPVLVQKPRDSGDDTLAAPDPDAELPWPSRDRFTTWWDAQRSQYQTGIPYIFGRPASAPELLKILSHGALASRPLAAERLQRLTRHPRFPTESPAPKQSTLFPILPKEFQ